MAKANVEEKTVVDKTLRRKGWGQALRPFSGPCSLFNGELSIKRMERTERTALPFWKLPWKQGVRISGNARGQVEAKG